jgi:hypothetical protein
MGAKKPIAEVSRVASSLLAELGFAKRNGDIFTKPIDDEVLGWLGLNRAVARSDDLLEINPVVWVRHQQLEKLVATLSGRAFHAYIPPTASMHLGYLMPERHYVPWVVGGHVELVVQEMVKAIADHGLPFIERNAVLGTLVSTMGGGEVGAREQVAYRLPVAYLLLGDIERARGALERSSATLGERRDAAAEAFRSFASQLERRLQSSATS